MQNIKEIITLNEFIVKGQDDSPSASGEFSSLLRDIVFAAKMIHREVNMAGLVDIIGSLGRTNAYGEEVAKLDMYANNQLISALNAGGQCCGIASEENEDYVAFDHDRAKQAKYVVLFDPLDGSSNIDVDVSIGTIFSIYHRVSPEGELCDLRDFLQNGSEQLAAGYIIYGPSTIMVYTTGEGVHGFTLDPSIGEFCLSHENIRVPQDGKIYSVNEGYQYIFSEGVNNYIKYCKTEDKATNRPYKGRYIGSMVADIHRTLIKGGIFMYPATSKTPDGKLRLLYEGNPLAYVMEQAGGKATDGNGNRLLDVEAKHLHQCSPVYSGSMKMVTKAEEILQGVETI